MQTVTIKCFKICRLGSRGGGEKTSKLTDSYILLHINDHPHVANRMQDQLNETQWGVFKYLAYSLDLWSYDFHISGSFKKALMFKLHNDM